MNGFTIDVSPAAESPAGDPGVEITLRRTAGRGRGTSLLDLEHWGMAGRGLAAALDWLRGPLGAAVSGASLGRSRIRFPVRRLDFMPEGVHAALGLPQASGATLLLRLRTDGAPWFAWEIETGRPASPKTDAGLYRDGGDLTYLPPGLQEALEAVSAAARDGLDAMMAAWLVALPLDSWGYLVAEGSLRLRLASRMSLVARHDRRLGFAFAIAPVRPEATDTPLLHDPMGAFMSALDASQGRDVPPCLSVDGTPVYMTDAFRREALTVRAFNRLPMAERAEWGIRLEQMVRPGESSRAIARVETFGERVAAYGPLAGKDYADLAAAMRAPRDPEAEAARRARPGAGPAPAVDPARILADFGEPDDEGAGAGAEDAIEGPAVPRGAAACDATGPGAAVPVPGEGPDAARDGPAFAADPGDESGPAAAGTAVPVPTGFTITFENMGEEVNLVESGARRADPGTFDPAGVAALMAERDARGRPLPFARPHQLDAVRWVWDHWRQGGDGCLLCDEPGTGKTLSMLLAALSLRHVLSGPCLFVVEDHMAVDWAAELALRVRGGLSFMHAHGTDFRRASPIHQLAEMRRRGLVLTTWNTLSEFWYVFQVLDCGIVFADEASVAKNPLSRRRQALRGLKAGLMVLATGTPIENGIADLWSLVDTARPGHLGAWLPFKALHVGEGAAAGARDELCRRLLDGPVPTILRRTKEGLGLALPPKVVHRVVLDMRGPQAEAYGREADRPGRPGTLRHQLRRLSLHHDPRALARDGAPTQWRARLWLQQSAVLDHVLRLLQDLRDAGRKAILFTTDIVDGQEPIARALGLALGLKGPVPAVSGRTPQAERDARIRAFRESDGFDVLMLSNRLCSRGLTLTEASAVILLSRWYNPAVEAQAMDRVHRLGLAHAVDIYVPMARHPRIGGLSYDLVLDRLLSRKRADSDGFLDVRALTADEIEEALSAEAA